MLLRAEEKSLHGLRGPAKIAQEVAVDAVGDRQIRVELERPSEARLGARQVLGGMLDGLSDQPVAAAEVCPRGRVSWVSLETAQIRGLARS